MNRDALELKKCLLKSYESDSPKRKKQKEKVFSKGELADFRSEVTKDWYMADLYDVTHLITCGVAKRPGYVEKGIPFLSAQNARPFKTNLNKIRYIDQEAFEKITVGGKPEKGDILYTRVGNCGEAAKVPYDFDFGVYVSLTLIKPIKCLLNSDYLVAFLNSMYGLVQAGQGAIGIGLKNLNVDNVRRYTIPLPPLAEQQEIARRLDDLLAQVDTLKARLDNVPGILKRFRQSVLAAAVSGKLTEDWREENGISLDSWSQIKVKDIVSSIEAGKNLKCIESPPRGDEHGIIKISAVTWGIYNEEESKTLPDKTLFLEHRRIKVGDFLISRANTIELLGNPVIVHEVTKNLMLSDKVLRLVMAEDNKPWLNIFLRSHDGRKQIESRSTGNQMSMRNIGQKALLDIDLPQATLEEQTEIIRRVEQLFAFADKIEAKVNNAQTRVDKLTQSILKKAFQGDLTAEWREQNPDLISGENSAEALLERIKAEREAMKPVKKGRRKK